MVHTLCSDRGGRVFFCAAQCGAACPRSPVRCSRVRLRVILGTPCRIGMSSRPGHAGLCDYVFTISSSYVGGYFLLGGLIATTVSVHTANRVSRPGRSKGKAPLQGSPSPTSAALLCAKTRKDSQGTIHRRSYWARVSKPNGPVYAQCTPAGAPVSPASAPLHRHIARLCVP